MNLATSSIGKMGLLGHPLVSPPSRGISSLPMMEKILSRMVFLRYSILCMSYVPANAQPLTLAEKEKGGKASELCTSVPIRRCRPLRCRRHKVTCAGANTSLQAVSRIGKTSKWTTSIATVSYTSKDHNRDGAFPRKHTRYTLQLGGATAEMC